MASKYETGHFKNLSNFSSLISYLDTLSSYAPDATEIQMRSLQTLYDDTKTATDNLVTMSAALQQSINDRQLKFEQMRKLSTKIMKYLEANSTDDEAIKDVLTHYRDLGSKKLSRKETVGADGSVSEKTYSSSRLSFESKAENFQKMVERLATIPGYAPSNVELQIPTLQTVYENLHTINRAVNEEYHEVNQSRTARNQLMYEKNTGLVDIAQRVKKHLQYQYGSTSEQYRHASAIKFTKKRMK